MLGDDGGMSDYQLLTLERGTDGDPVPPENLEVAVLDRSRNGRKFRRLSADELTGILGG